MADDRLSYEEADGAFVSAIRRRAPPPAPADLARAVNEAAVAWETAAYAEFFALRSTLGETARRVIEAEIDAERAELLRGLWADIADAYRDAPDSD